ncbi:hypothetical protein LAV82_27470 [Bacillus sp. ILBB4]|nr:hypothetical protein [Bacillus sp. ILBB4]
MKINKVVIQSTILATALGSFSSLASAAENNSNSNTYGDDLPRNGSFTLEDGDYNYDIKSDENKNTETLTFSNENGEEQVATYYKDKGEIWLNGELVVNNIVKDTEVSSNVNTSQTQQMQVLKASSTKYFTLGNSSTGSGTYNYVSSDTGSFNVINATAAGVATTIILLLLQKKPKVAAVTGLAATIMGSFTSDKFTVYYSLYHYKDAHKAHFYQDSINFYKGSSMSNRIANVTHYYGLSN